MNADFKTRLMERKRLIGTLLTLPSPEIAEISADAGFDWLFLDMEHGLLDIAAVQRIVQAVGERCACIVRVPANEEMWIKKALDTGAAGLIVPHLNTAEEASRVAGWSQYPPEGGRSIGIARAQGYGARLKESIESANKNLALIAQAEHIDAVLNIEAILNVPGMDAVFVGPFDLSASLGKPGRVLDDDVLEAITKIRKACIKRGVPVGIFAKNVEFAKKSLDEGYSLLCIGTDATILSTAAVQIIKDLG
jgi:2-keto-3-deoxy-L-rhamnonate aldolase RhmA